MPLPQSHRHDVAVYIRRPGGGGRRGHFLLGFKIFFKLPGLVALVLLQVQAAGDLGFRFQDLIKAPRAGSTSSAPGAGRR